MKPSIFISYAREQSKFAKEIQLQILARQHDWDVFLDTSRLVGGGGIDEQIKKAVLRCDVFIFLVSPDALIDDKYSQAELRWAQNRWKHPGWHVLPVTFDGVAEAEIPPYLKAAFFVPAGRNTGLRVAESLEKVILHQNRTSKTLGRNAGLASGVLTAGLIQVSDYANVSIPMWMMIPVYDFKKEIYESAPAFQAIPFSIAMASLTWWINEKSAWSFFVTFIGLLLVAGGAVSIFYSVAPWDAVARGVDIRTAAFTLDGLSALAGSFLPGLTGAIGTWFVVALSCEKARDRRALEAAGFWGAMLGLPLCLAELALVPFFGISTGWITSLFVLLWQVAIGACVGHAIAPRWK